MRHVLAVVVIVVKLTNAFNICQVSSSVCVPMADIQVMLAQVITNEHDVSLVAVSVVRGRFSVPRLLSAICTRECRRQFWADGEYCRMKCAEKQVLFIV
ncbi:hypothetical protein Tcan_03582 [Toxocara canis]|uniref:Secreted protein n=1 Tax=Toxocara canis TaxID=6265 RepID=A0A0B2V9J3_TOXCA|nr:hypothetical protein Tcan_03582 [Toxocara canis]